MDNNELNKAIEALLDGGYKKSKKGQMIKLYRLAFPLDTNTDFNCPGCVLKCWGKLELYFRDNSYFSPQKSTDMAEKKQADNRYKLKNPPAKGQNLNFPKARVFELNEETLTDAIAQRLIAAGYGDHLIEVTPPKKSPEA